MKTLAMIVVLSSFMLIGCSGKPAASNPSQNAKREEPVYEVKSALQLFVDHYYHDIDGRFNDTYCGKTLRLKVFYIDGNETKAVFAIRSEDCGRSPYINIDRLEEARTQAGESPFGRAIYATKSKDVDFSAFTGGDFVIVDIRIISMQDNSRMIAQCTRIAKGN